MVPPLETLNCHSNDHSKCPERDCFFNWWTPGYEFGDMCSYLQGSFFLWNVSENSWLERIIVLKLRCEQLVTK
ncbi:hypothetical protein JTB14_003186 [Gonioctena quinquepunctata]|nr:hypothetical protein JTB14_003186 [Gonioctena quinquepunctata]